MARLPPGEAERRAAERKRRAWGRIGDGSAYRHFDPSDGFGHGSPEQWEAAAAGRRLERPRGGHSGDLGLLGVTALPDQLTALRRAYRLQTRHVHPDVPGGSAEAFRALHDAYERLEKHYAR